MVNFKVFSFFMHCLGSNIMTTVSFECFVFFRHFQMPIKDMTFVKKGWNELLHGYNSFPLLPGCSSSKIRLTKHVTVSCGFLLEEN